MRQVAVWGAAGHARVVANVLRLAGWDVVGFLDNVSPERLGERFAGAEVLGGEAALPRLRENGVTHLAIGVGDNEARLALGRTAREAGFELAGAVHPTAAIAADAQLGAGTVVGPGAVINPASVLGELVVVNSSAVVEHDCRLGDGVHVAPGAVLAGWVTVGDGSFVGAGATVIDRVTLGRNAVVGAGATAIRDVGDGVTVIGTPARELS